MVAARATGRVMVMAMVAAMAVRRRGRPLMATAATAMIAGEKGRATGNRRLFSRVFIDALCS